MPTGCLATASALALPLVAAADTPPPQLPPQQRVEVQASTVTREATPLARLVVTRGELGKLGETQLAEALKRLPGVSVVAVPGRAAEIRLGGLGGGYTRVLLNGEPLPPGFDVESLPLALVERVELSTGGAADSSAQAIAGTVNIVLRRVAREGQRDLKITAISERGQPQLFGELQLGGRDEAFSWLLAATLARELNHFPFLYDQTEAGADGVPTRRYSTDKREINRSTQLALAPRLSWTLPREGQLASDALLRWRRIEYGVFDRRETPLGEPPATVRNDLRFAIDAAQLRWRTAWKQPLAGGGEIDAHATLTWAQRDSFAWNDGFDAAGRYVLDKRVDSLAEDRGLAFGARWRWPAAPRHDITLGTDGEVAQRLENRTEELRQPPASPAQITDERYDARTQRLALYAQDEWTLGKRLSGYLGLRWEQLSTDSRGNVLQAVQTRGAVASPIVQLRWKLDEKAQGREALRLAVSRSYKAPNTRDLMPRRFVNNNNAATTPDRQGNPELKPELAWGAELGYERPLPAAGQLALKAFVRRIDAVILDELLLQNGAWVQRPANQGRARVLGLEADARGGFSGFGSVWPQLAWRANAGRYASRLSAVPGPNNRLATQTPWTLNLGLDWRPPASVGWTLSANVNAQGGGLAQTTLAQTVHNSPRRALDLSASRRLDARQMLRLSLSQLGARDGVTTTRVVLPQGPAAGSTETLVETVPAATTLRLVWEIKLGS